ncbi:cellulase family glycosylhydrolase [Vibrio paucivorans]|uniref:cellulase n=1 Tax=Vibrio paucivorans TaxID=2829489 RepID=A0A9X3HU72_9VIBR|nr:cellulase family glycosylhydrolase [Vibrio paucivorans]MCW8336339.1 cellulase family glycosylhydrolase [Vibrio paucivorans]
MKLSTAASLICLLLGGQAFANLDNNNDWLHVEGNKVVNKHGQQVWLTGANWFGFNTQERVLHGLWQVNLDDTIKSISRRGVNLLRIPISTELIHEWSQGQTSIPSVNTSANPELSGKTDLQVFDALIESSKKYGVKILLDVHSAEADNMGHIYEMWYKGDITPEIFYSTWEWITERYQNDDTIIAMDIQNEPHGKPYSSTTFAKWDDSTDINNWKYACETASNRILAINPNLIVMCEGIESYPIDGKDWGSQDEDDYYNNWWGGNLRGVRDYPIDLGDNQDQLMYSPHDYGPLVFAQDWFYEGFNKDTLYQDVWKDNWMYIHEENIAPLLIGEWGGFMDGGDNEKWMLAIRDLIVEHELHHTFWAINPNSGDTGGLLENDWVTWDEEKYAIFEPSLWKDQNNRYIGLDHQVPLGGEGYGTNVAEYYGSLFPSIAVTEPEENGDVLINSELKIQYSSYQIDSVQAYVGSELVATGNDEYVVVSVPENPGPFVVKLVGLMGEEPSDVVATLSLNAVESVPASINLVSPTDGESVTQGGLLTVVVELVNASGYQASFDSETLTVNDGSDAVFVVDAEPGNYSVSVVGIDQQNQPVTSAHSVDIAVVPPVAVSCELGTQDVWPGGFVLNNIQVTNTGTEAISGWTLLLKFEESVSLINGWNAEYTQLDDHTISMSGSGHTLSIEPGQSHAVGLQGAYQGGFSQPECVLE